MLTKNDFTQIRTIVREEIEERTPKIVQKEARQIVQEELAPVRADIKVIKKDVVKIRSDIKTIVSFFGKEYVELRNRVERIEEHLGLSPLAD